MNLFKRFGFIAVSVLAGFLILALTVGPLSAQTGGTPQQPNPQPAPPADANAQAAAPSPNAPVQVVVQKPPLPDPPILEDGGFSIEPFYWLTKQAPALYGGAQALAFSNLSYPGHSKKSYGGELGIPAGRSSTLRFSYFRLQGNSNTTLTAPSTVFSEGYDAGDYLASSYRIQSAKISWDYLSYTWHKPSGAIHLKTLYELQYVTVSTNVAAPFKPVATDASTGNTDYNAATGSKNLIWPTFGMELESALGKHFRWEVKASGFGIPHRANIWDAEGSIAFRVGVVELIAGEKAFHYKTSPRSDEFFVQTLDGVYGGLRFYWGNPRVQ